MSMKTSPAQRLFPEVLVHILEKLFESENENREPIPFTASQVCMDWRSTVLSAPVLWGHIRIPRDFPQIAEVLDNFDDDTSDSEDENEDGDLEAFSHIASCLRLMIKRAASFPLIIHYHTSRPYPFQNAMFKVLLEHVHLWASSISKVWMPRKCSKRKRRHFFESLINTMQAHGLILETSHSRLVRL
ncbi:hypothetical protein AMATHDRAFT_50738 [Amanita thiersii Skay4041]|uniref:F-box domain-containing protein n=1 Tax=Amanita thiersii Skay4041 TaxID=703135 RepID=A0A2A9NC03_9AGAR|nr:hypothetical protein AMATHDRAFT_50738 [Amanita thiersii Skay4041]